MALILKNDIGKNIKLYKQNYINPYYKLKKIDRYKVGKYEISKYKYLVILEKIVNVII